MSSLPDQLKGFLTSIDRNTGNLPLLNHFERNTGLPRSYAILGFVAVYFILIFLNFGGIGQLLSNFAGFLLPGYYSILALQTSTSKDDTQLLTYWVVFAFFNVIEFWSRAILYWVPFYYLFKTVFLLYIGIPSFGGATLIYNSIIKPISDQYVKPVAASTTNTGVGAQHTTSHHNLSNKIDDASEGISSSVHI
ncbi:unnamed protein product [Candida verbasci]|uniref:Protein YOP1 n=1 Tax=Candida verbasci TaxID=1227364 RepID=A0A9W4TV94_9ASCO|nr:unnamed protein product [Candida verbasci]